MQDPYKIVHLSLSNKTDTATVQNWLDENYPLFITHIFVDGLDVYILYNQ